MGNQVEISVAGVAADFGEQLPVHGSVMES